MSVALHQRQELSARPGVVRPWPRGPILTLTFWSVSHQVRHGSFPFSGSKSAVVPGSLISLTGAQRTTPKVLHRHKTSRVRKNSRIS